MSQDIELIINHTSDLFFQEIPDNPLEQNYRLLDAPLTRYFIGIFRMIFGVEPLGSDWNWSKSWSENQAAIPSEDLLFASRLSAAIFFPFSVILFALIVKEIPFNNISLVIISILMFSMNSLLIFHTRRAMAESGMIFFLLLSLFMMIKIEKKWLFLVSIPIALAINSKQTLFFIIFVAIFMIFYYFKNQFKMLILQFLLFFALLAGIYFILNPIMWREPVRVVTEMMGKRAELSRNQEESIESVTPEFLATTTSKRITAFIAQIFILQPAPQEISNYQAELNQSILHYFKFPLNNGLIRNLVAGSLQFLLFIFGIYVSIKNHNVKFNLVFVSGFVFFCLELLFLLEIPFQRYYLPAIPFTIIFTMIGLERVLIKLKNSFSK